MPIIRDWPLRFCQIRPTADRGYVSFWLTGSPRKSTPVCQQASRSHWRVPICAAISRMCFSKLSFSCCGVWVQGRGTIDVEQIKSAPKKNGIEPMQLLEISPLNTPSGPTAECRSARPFRACASRGCPSPAVRCLIRHPAVRYPCALTCHI